MTYSRSRQKREASAISQHPQGRPTEIQSGLPAGEHLAWFSDSDTGYKLVVVSDKGEPEKRIDIGESKMAWGGNMVAGRRAYCLRR